jgi:hypothetical protein
MATVRGATRKFSLVAHHNSRVLTTGKLFLWCFKLYQRLRWLTKFCNTEQCSSLTLNNKEHISNPCIHHQSNEIFVSLYLPPKILKFPKIWNNYVQKEPEYIAMGSDDGELRSRLVKFWALSIVGIPKNTVFRRLDPFPSSGKGVGGMFYSILRPVI